MGLFNRRKKNEEREEVRELGPPRRELPPLPEEAQHTRGDPLVPSFHTPSPVLHRFDPHSIKAPDEYQASSTKDFDVLNAKLDTIKAQLDHVLQRLEKEERR